MSRRKRRTGRRTLLKFRVRPLVRMPKSELFRKLRHMIHTGEVPDDVDVAYVEYGHKKAEGRQFRAGDRLLPHEITELDAFYTMLTSVEPKDITAARSGPARVRFERPDV